MNKFLIIVWMVVVTLLALIYADMRRTVSVIEDISSEGINFIKE